VHDGTWSSFRQRRFGAPADDVPPKRFVVFSQNHDQVGNRAYGDRLPEPARPLAAFCTLLAPFTPMLFMGEEYGERHPFQFFSDHIDEEIATATRDGRRREFAAFAQFGEEIPDPQAEETFVRSKLSGEGDAAIAALYGALIAARRELPKADVDAIEFDERARWLLVTRGDFQLACNFSESVVRVPVMRAQVQVASQPAKIEGETLVLEPLAGALLR
jgi:maltooligosyltrehalose trehalohydrolase